MQMTHVTYAQVTHQTNVKPSTCETCAAAHGKRETRADETHDAHADDTHDAHADKTHDTQHHDELAGQCSSYKLHNHDSSSRYIRVQPCAGVVLNFLCHAGYAQEDDAHYIYPMC